ncbi:unnamed protein product [Euphydryas editha]|uniref:Uncharacterized protein n=1 Tax=Euphydryas editha TaxID=104508 RepID=A0AAU9UZG2_EUPED|nr:unnamed protein product [Euphydryas editha]
MRILPLIVFVACLLCQTKARPQDEEPRGNRGLLKRGLVGKAKTTTTTPAPQEEEEYEDEAEYQEGEPQEPSTEAPPSSTEGKKLVGNGVRPFRSNTDLLEALKRRRAQAAEAKIQSNSASSVAQQASDSQTEAPVKASYSKKRFNTATRETKAEEAPAPAKPSRGRFGRPSSKSLQETEPEEQNDTTPPARTGRTFRRGGY